MRQAMHARRTAALAWLGCAAWGGCAGLGGDPIDSSRQHLQRADYYLAFHELLDAGVPPTSPAYRAAELAYLLDAGQEAVFADEEHRALELFGRALELDPGNEVATRWIAKCRHKLADRACRRGDERRRAGDLRAALLRYREATDQVAGHPGALAGVAAVGEILSKRRERAQEHYLDGVQALGEQLWPQSWYHMVNAVQMDPAHEKAKERRDDVGERLAEQRYERARDLEKGAHYGAALKEYLALRESGAPLEGLEARIAHMRREVEAERLVRAAEMAAFRRDYAEARSLLEQALEQTVTEQAHISDLLILIRERDFEERYEHAHILELEHQLEEALASYRAIAEVWPDFRDVKTLISGLESAIQVAAEAHARGQAAEQAGDLPAAIAAYEEAQLVYPGYRELDARIAELKAKIGHVP
jgi:tetratricopeptide (TPR) repeat protein